MRKKYIFLAIAIMLLIFAAACDRDFFTDRLIQPKEAEAEFKTEDFEIVVDSMPEIIGGIEAIQRNISYPETAKDDGMSGTVFILAYVDTEGDIAHIEVANGVRDDLDLAAIEAVKSVKFIPGKKDGVPVGVRVGIPIHFRLTSE